MSSLTVTACSKPGEDVTVKEAKTMVDNDEVYILDCRTPEEFQSGHIKGAQNIDVYDERFAEKVKTIKTEKPILVYCRSGARSSQAQGMMKNMGMKKVINMAGGFSAWAAAGYPAEM